MGWRIVKLWPINFEPTVRPSSFTWLPSDLLGNSTCETPVAIRGYAKPKISVKATAATIEAVRSRLMSVLGGESELVREALHDGPEQESWEEGEGGDDHDH